jgi:hypothetical protein
VADYFHDADGAFRGDAGDYETVRVGQEGRAQYSNPCHDSRFSSVFDIHPWRNSALERLSRGGNGRPSRVIRLQLPRVI